MRHAGDGGRADKKMRALGTQMASIGAGAEDRKAHETGRERTRGTTVSQRPGFRGTPVSLQH